MEFIQHLIAFVAFLTVVCSNSHHRIKIEKEGTEMWRSHTNKVQKFACKIPQPRSIDIGDLFDQDILRYAMNIIPSSTVLYRCGSSGCCNSPDKHCVAHTSEEVKLIFYVKEASRSVSYVEVGASNHTSCACRFRNDSNRPK